MTRKRRQLQPVTSTFTEDSYLRSRTSPNRNRGQRSGGWAAASLTMIYAPDSKGS